MNQNDIFDAFGDLDVSLLERSETKAPRSHVWRNVFAAAAAVAVIIGGAAALRGLDPMRDVTPPNPPDVQSEQDTQDVQNGSELNDDASNPVEPMASPELVFNEVESMVYANVTAADVCIFGEELTEEELAAAAPDILPRNVYEGGRVQTWDVSGAAGYYGDGSLEGIHLEFTNPEWGGKVSVTLRKPDAIVHSDVILETPEPVTGTIGPLTYTAYRWQDDWGVMMWADFQIGDVLYSVSVNTELDNAERAEDDMLMVLSCYQGRALDGSAPDLDGYHMKETHVWIDSELSPDEARQDETFGRYMPESGPEGFSAGLIRRYKADGTDELYESWSDGGYAYLTWRASYMTDADDERVTDVEDRENYDLSLYPIPMADSVPPELRQIVDNPIFRSEQLTLDTVNARAYKVNDAGDTDGWRMNFSVLYGDVLVRISAKGVSPEWIFAELQNISA